MNSKGEQPSLCVDSLVFCKKINNCLFQTVEVGIHEACFDVHPGMPAGKKGEKNMLESTGISTAFFKAF